MAHKRSVVQVKPFCAVTFTPEIKIIEVLTALTPVLSSVEMQSDLFLFDFTDYYESEMGTGLLKQFFVFEGLMHPERLSKIKTTTNELELLWQSETGRQVNLDPGYVTGAKLVLASAKDYSHRLYLADGIYGDVQLRFQHGKFVPSEWTYPDYQTESAIQFFETVRKTYVKQEREYGRNGL